MSLKILKQKRSSTIPKTLYKCPRCGYEITRKSSMRSHIQRKKLCPLILRDINIKKIEQAILERSIKVN